MLDPRIIRRDFPILKEKINGYNLVYFDNAATSQKPLQIINSISEYYLNSNSNIHRGIHTLANRATEGLEKTRGKVAGFINSKAPEEIIFTNNATDALNTIAYGFAGKLLSHGDSILVTRLEHHSNFVPWQQLCINRGFNFKIVDLDKDGYLSMEDFRSKLTKDVKILAVSQMSNVTGIFTPLEEIIRLAHINGSYVVVDGAQGIAYRGVDVQKIDCDFYCFSPHKLYSSMGLGILYGKKELLNEMKPFRYGGGMVDTVLDLKTSFSEIPYKLEAGTLNVAAAYSLFSALDYIESIGLANIYNHEKELFAYALERLSKIPGIEIYGKGINQTGLISFNISNMNCFDVALFLDNYGIAVRSGTHCAQPLMNHFKIPGTVRASFALYNTKEEIDWLIECLRKLIAV